jgi:2-succinyl-5-enolpyruvyl-6-hydroxy-3-cyclohexene-1-carboxylate synthase
LGSQARHHRVMTLRHLSTTKTQKPLADAVGCGDALGSLRSIGSVGSVGAIDTGGTAGTGSPADLANSSVVGQVLSLLTPPADVQATFCATLLDEWVRAGITRAVVSPGSRSTPMALAIAADQRIEMHVVVDERSASFFALGMAKASGVPVIVLCTSGTAAVEYHPAVVEADLDHVGLIVCTADRPKELHGIGAPQTVDQQHLFGRSVRLFLDLPVAEVAAADTWRSTAARIALAAADGPLGAGPVQVNLGFREPLVGRQWALPTGRSKGAPWHESAGVASRLRHSELLALADRLRGKRGLIVAGAGCGEAGAVHALALVLGWPVLADARSGARGVAAGSSPASITPEVVRASANNAPNIPGMATLVSNADSILRNEPWAQRHQPEVVLRLGAPWASKVLNQWLAEVPDDVLVDPTFAWLDPNRASALHIAADATELCSALTAVLSGADAAAPNDWLDSWSKAEADASSVLADRLDSATALSSSTIAEPALARALVRGLGQGAALVVSSSMPIRDVEWFGGEHGDLRILANRGANGIDGVLSTAFGVAAVHAGPTVCLIGDLAFLHDVGALSIAAQNRVNATVVIVDNRGGGIFEFLPQATGVARDRFELLYGTEQHVNLADVARAFGLPVTEATTISEALAAVNHAASGVQEVRAQEVRGVQVVIVHTNRQTNVDVHRELNAAIVARIDQTSMPA